MSKAKPLPDLDLLNALFTYNPKTGLLFSRVLGRNLKGRTSKEGYLHIQIHKKEYSIHRVVWKIVHGADPTGEIDHKNGVRNDNRLCNLRDVSTRRNGQNQKCHREGHMSGTVLRKPTNTWESRIKYKGVKYNLGNFDSEVIAHIVYMDCCAEIEVDTNNTMNIIRKYQLLHKQYTTKNR